MPFAPAPGTRVCGINEFTGPVQSFDMDGFPLILVRAASGLRAYVNACPHQYLPLDWRSNSILSDDAKVLRCSNHEAGFDACSGAGVIGLGAGCSLDQVPITERGDDFVIGEEDS